MCKYIFNSGIMSKLLFAALAALCIWFLQMKIEKLQKTLTQKEEQCLVLQTANKKQQENISRLLQEQQKQEEILLQAMQERQMLVQKYQTRQNQIRNSNDKASADWKKTPVPQTILQILQK